MRRPGTARVPVIEGFGASRLSEHDSRQRFQASIRALAATRNTTPLRRGDDRPAFEHNLPGLLRLKDRLLFCLRRGDSFAGNLYPPEKEPKTNGCQKSERPASGPERIFAECRENESAKCRA